jgi:hypothetical protein
MSVLEISLYVVGIHFRQTFGINSNKTDSKGKDYVTGDSILEYAGDHYGLRYKLTTTPPSVVPGHLNYASYTPNKANDDRPAKNLPRITFPLKPPKVFPFYGQPLSLTEILAPIGQASQVLQYTVQSIDKGKPAPEPLFLTDVTDSAAPPEVQFISPTNDGSSSFGNLAFPDGSEIRIRLLNIYCTY